MIAERPNIVLVSVDSLRADHCGYLGDDRGLTPTIDRLADSGVAYTQAITPGPRTYSAMPAIFTGVHRERNSLEEYPGGREWEWRLSNIDDHIAYHEPFPERLQEMGYSTVGFSPNPWTSSASGFDRGFDYFFDFSGNGSKGPVERLAKAIPRVNEEGRPVELVSNMVSGNSFFSQWEGYYDRVSAVLEEISEPYFLWVFLLDTHYPFITTRSHRKESTALDMYYSAYRAEKAMGGGTDTMSNRLRTYLERSYRDSVRAVDDFVKTIRADTIDDDPVMILHSDHGESFGEHGTYGHHRGDVYEENIHVPYIVHNAGATETVTAPTSLETIHDATIAIAERGFIDPEAYSQPHVIASDERGERKAVRGVRFKLVQTPDRSSLYDLDADPNEQSDCSEANADLKNAFGNYLDEFDRHQNEITAIRRAVRSVGHPHVL